MNIKDVLISNKSATLTHVYMGIKGLRTINKTLLETSISNFDSYFYL